MESGDHFMGVEDFFVGGGAILVGGGAILIKSLCKFVRIQLEVCAIAAEN